MSIYSRTLRRPRMATLRGNEALQGAIVGHQRSSILPSMRLDVLDSKARLVPKIRIISDAGQSVVIVGLSPGHLRNDALEIIDPRDVVQHGIAGEWDDSCPEAPSGAWGFHQVTEATGGVHISYCTSAESQLQQLSSAIVHASDSYSYVPSQPAVPGTIDVMVARPRKQYSDLAAASCRPA